jgi:hypothetical protein
LASPLAQVRSKIAELEAHCAQLAALIDAQDWNGLESLLHEMGKTRHSLTDAWAAAQSERTPEVEKDIATRVRRVLEYRSWQLSRLRDFNAGVSERLGLLSKWKTYARAVGKQPNAAALFSDIR